MLTEYEARQLARERSGDFAPERDHVVPLAIACAAALLILAGLAGMDLLETETGPAGNVYPSGTPAAHASPAPPAHVGKSDARAPYRPQLEAEAQSKQVFHERRRRYIEAYPDSHVARQMGEVAPQRDAFSDGGYAAYSNE